MSRNVDRINAKDACPIATDIHTAPFSIGPFLALETNVRARIWAFSPTFVLDL